MNQQDKLMISRSQITQIKKLEESIQRLVGNSSLNQKMKASQIYNDRSQKPMKVSSIMQTSSIIPSDLKRNNLAHKKQDNVQKVSVPVKSTQERKIQQKQFLLVQNKHLKQQALNLIEQLQTLLSETKTKKYGINLTDEQQPQQLKLKKTVLAQQLAKIIQLQSKIAFEQRQLVQVYGDSLVMAQQSQIKILQNELQRLQKQKKGVITILKKQSKGIQDIQMSPQFREKFNRTKEQLQKIKQQCKVLLSKTLQSEKLLRRKHQKAVDQHTKIKKYENIIKQNKTKLKKGIPNDKIVTQQMISEVEQEILQLQNERQMSQKSWLLKMANIEVQLETRRLQVQKMQIILKDKDKQARLNDLRIKQLKKLSTSQLGQRKKLSLSGDQANKTQLSNISQVPGRKRNIKIFEPQIRQKFSQPIIQQSQNKQ